MEFVEGETLENLIQRLGRVEAKLALDIAEQVASGLAAVHKKGLVHRDIKPSNIMVSLDEDGDPSAKIIDLGLAKPVAASHFRGRHFTAWSFCGNTGVRQSRAIHRSGRRYPFRCVFAWRDALENADRPSAIPRLLRRGDVSASARPVTARTARGCSAAARRFP